MLIFFNSNSSLAIWLSNCLSDDGSLSFEIKIGGGLASLRQTLCYYLSRQILRQALQKCYVLILASPASNWFWTVFVSWSGQGCSSLPLIVFTVFWVFSGILCGLFRAFLALVNAIGSSLFTAVNLSLPFYIEYVILFWRLSFILFVSPLYHVTPRYVSRVHVYFAQAWQWSAVHWQSCSFRCGLISLTFHRHDTFVFLWHLGSFFRPYRYFSR